MFTFRSMALYLNTGAQRQTGQSVERKYRRTEQKTVPPCREIKFYFINMLKLCARNNLVLRIPIDDCVKLI